MLDDDALIISVNPQARRTVLKIDPLRRAAILTVPRTADTDRGLAYAQSHKRWIAEQLAQLPAAAPFTPGASAPVRGRPHTLAQARTPGPARFDPGAPARLTVYAPSEDRFAARVRRALIAEARTDLVARSHAYADALGARIAAIAVKDTRSRWGSCTHDGKINFSWRLICAPSDVLDYVAAHEVAHLIERNHGPRFWALVRQLFGPCDAQRAWLREHGAELFAVGADR